MISCYKALNRNVENLVKCTSFTLYSSVESKDRPPIVDSVKCCSSLDLISIIDKSYIYDLCQRGKLLKKEILLIAIHNVHLSKKEKKKKHWACLTALAGSLQIQLEYYAVSH